MTASDVINGLGSLLTSILKPSTSGVSDKSVESLKSIEMILCTTLITVCDVALPNKPNARTVHQKKNTGTSSSLDLNALLSVLTSQILRPLIISFYSLSWDFTSSMLQNNTAPKAKETSSSLPVDIRSDVLAFIRRILAIITKKYLFKWKKQDLFDFIALEGAERIKSLWSHSYHLNEIDKDASLKKSNNSGGARVLHRFSRITRLRRLARKDALWYYCAILQDVLASPPSSEIATIQGTGSLLSSNLILQKIIDILNGLFSICKESTCEGAGANTVSHEPKDMDNIERGMIIAVLENAWLHGYMGLPCKNVEDISYKDISDPEEPSI